MRSCEIVNPEVNYKFISKRLFAETVEKQEETPPPNRFQLIKCEYFLVFFVVSDWKWDILGF